MDAQRQQVAREMSAQPVRETSVKERDVVEELQGRFARICDAHVADESKKLAQVQYQVDNLNPDISLPARLQAGDITDQLNNWRALGDAARRGVFLMSNTSFRSPAYVTDPYIRSLKDRAAAIGLVEYDPDSPQVTNRY